MSDRKCFIEQVTLSWFLKDDNELIREIKKNGTKEGAEFPVGLRVSEAYHLAKVLVAFGGVPGLKSKDKMVI